MSEFESSHLHYNCKIVLLTVIDLVHEVGAAYHEARRQQKKRQLPEHKQTDALKPLISNSATVSGMKLI